MNAIILFAHGSRDPLWFQPFEMLRERVLARTGGQPVRLAFLEFAAPTLNDAIAQLVSEGVHSIRIVPVFLAAGAHVRNDLPHLVQEARLAHPRAIIELAPPVGEQAVVLDAIAQVCTE
jgi:sirohydrochlorin cobaltochelatase